MSAYLGFTEAVREASLDAHTMDSVRIHSGDPGSSGANNQVGDLKSATINAAATSNGVTVRATDADVKWDGLTPDTDIEYYSFWDQSGPTLKFIGRREGGQAKVDGQGKFGLAAGTKCYVENKTYE